MSKLPAHKATAVESKTGCQSNFPTIPIQAADGAIASAHPSSRLAAQVNLFVSGYVIKYNNANGANIKAIALSM